MIGSMTTLFPGLGPEKVAPAGQCPVVRLYRLQLPGAFRRPTMTASDPLSLACADLLTGQYDCLDRIILNAYFPLGCRPGSFRT